MLRYIKAIFGKYDHYFLTPEEFFKKYAAIIIDIFGLEAVNDPHRGSKYQDNEEMTEIIEEIIQRPQEERAWVFFLGDIWDFVCAATKDLPWMRDGFARTLIAMRWRYRLGNHEGLGTNDKNRLKELFSDHPLYNEMVKALDTTKDLIVQLPNGVRVWMEHGDLITEKQRKDYMPYRYHDHGASTAKLVQVFFLDKLDLLKTKRPLPKGFIEEVRRQMDEKKADVFICGHFHPEGQRYYFDEKTRKLIIILPAHQLNKVKIPKFKAV